MNLPRASGNPTPSDLIAGPFGSGDLGPEAHAFVDFLAETGQNWWQTLPLGPTGYGNSPYQSPSSFAGNPLLISPKGGLDEGWLDARDLDNIPQLPADRADFDAATRLRMALLHRAFERFRAGGADLAFERFRAENHAWLDDYVFFNPSATPITVCPGTSGRPGSQARTPQSAPLAQDARRRCGLS